MSPLRTLRQLVVGPTGRHRGARAVTVPERIEVPLSSFFGTALPQFVDVPHGAIAPQAFRTCPPCGGDVPVVLHPGAHVCDSGHLTIAGGTR